jgi:hypothetical protein
MFGARGLGAVRAMFALLAALNFDGCALLTHQLDDPNEFLAINLKTDDFVKSLRCEVITFIVENRLREQIWKNYLGVAQDPKTHDVLPKYAAVFDQIVAKVKDYPFISLDGEQFAALSVDLKNINTSGINVQNDWKFTYPVRTATLHVGPAIAETNTFEYLPPLAIPQIADLGPARQRPATAPLHPAAIWSTAYYLQTTTDSAFYCYSSLAKSQAVTLEDAAKDIQGLVEDSGIYKELKNYQRIYVGSQTLASWLEKMAKQLYANQNTIFPTAENVLPGQIAYTFTLDLKPSMDLKYTYVASVINPFVPDISGAVEHSSQFSIFLNTIYSAAALGAKGGNSCNKDVPNAKCLQKH